MDWFNRNAPMDIKLTKWYFLLLFFVISSILSCVTNRTHVKNESKDKQFLAKGIFLKKCISKGFENTDEVLYLINTDKSFLTDMKLTVSELQIIDSLVLETYILIQKDSINSAKKWISDSGEMDYLIGKKVMYYCLSCMENGDIEKCIQ